MRHKKKTHECQEDQCLTYYDAQESHKQNLWDLFEIIKISLDAPFPIAFLSRDSELISFAVPLYGLRTQYLGLLLVDIISPFEIVEKFEILLNEMIYFDRQHEN